MNVPHRKAVMDATTIRGVLPNIASTAAWLARELSDGGKCTTTAAMTEANISAPKPAHTTRRSRPYPYTSVRISPKIYEIGKNNTPARKVTVPSNGTWMEVSFAGPIRFEQSRMQT